MASKNLLYCTKRLDCGSFRLLSGSWVSVCGSPLFVLSHAVPQTAWRLRCNTKCLELETLMRPSSERRRKLRSEVRKAWGSRLDFSLFVSGTLSLWRDAGRDDHEQNTQPVWSQPRWTHSILSRPCKLAKCSSRGFPCFNNRYRSWKTSYESFLPKIQSTYVKCIVIVVGRLIFHSGGTSSGINISDKRGRITWSWQVYKLRSNQYWPYLRRWHASKGITNQAPLWENIINVTPGWPDCSFIIPMDTWVISTFCMSSYWWSIESWCWGLSRTHLL